MTRFSNLDFSMGLPNFFKLSPKMLYLGPNHPKKLRLFVIYNFLISIEKDIENFTRNHTCSILCYLWIFLSKYTNFTCHWDVTVFCKLFDGFIFNLTRWIIVDVLDQSDALSLKVSKVKVFSKAREAQCYLIVEFFGFWCCWSCCTHNWLY